MDHVRFDIHQDDGVVTATLSLPCTVQAEVFSGGTPAAMRTGNPAVATYPGRMDVYILRIGPTPRIAGRCLWRAEARVLTRDDIEAIADGSTRYEGKRVLQALGLLPGWARTVRLKIADAVAALAGIDVRQAEDMLEVEVLHRLRPLLGREMLDHAAAAERRFRYVGPPVEPTTRH